MSEAIEPKPKMEKDENLSSKDSSTAEEKTIPPARKKLQTNLVMAAILMNAFLAALDMLIITVALPTIVKDLNAPNSGYAWIGSSFIIAVSAAGPIWGKTSDIFGRKPILLSANIVFMVGSLICALAENLGMLLAGRAIQGVGAGGLSVLTNVIISDMFSLRERGFYLSLIGLTWAFATAIGPLIGGGFAQNVSWRWCFWINLPCDGLAFALLFFLLKVHNPRTPLLAGLKGIDWLGSLTNTAATVLFLLGVQFGGVVFLWDSATVICLIIFGLLTYGLFFVVQWRLSPFPLLPPRIFAHRSTAAVLGVAFSHGIAYISGAYYIPLYFQTVLGATPILGGVWFLPSAGTLTVSILLSGIYQKKTGRYLELLFASFFVMILGNGLYTDLKPFRSWSRIVIYQIIAGAGIGPLFQAPLVAIQTKLAPTDIAAGLSAYTSMRNVASAISVVCGQVILQSRLSKHHTQFIDAGISNGLAEALSSGDAITAISQTQALPAAQRSLVAGVTNDAFRYIWVFNCAVSFAGLLVCFLITRSKLSSDHVVHQTGLAGMRAARAVASSGDPTPRPVPATEKTHSEEV